MVDKWMNKLWDRKDKILVGKYDIKIYDNKVHYHLIVKRNITIIQGNSATGKTTLIDMLLDYSQLGKNSGVTVVCERKCVAFRFQNDMKLQILQIFHFMQ